MNKRRELIEGIRMGSKPRIGIALSGGGVRGVAHLGVLKALNEAGIFPQSVSGSSAGALAGTSYCCGYKPDETLDLRVKTKLDKFMRPAISGKGIVKIDVLESFYSELLVHNDFPKLKIPRTVVATNRSIGQSAYFSEG